MDAAKRARLRAAGYAVYDHAADWLELSAEDRQLLDLKLALTRAFRQRRAASGLTARQIAARLKVKPTEVAELENFGGSLDLLFRGLFAVGGTLADVTSVKPRGRRKPAGPRNPVPA